MGGNRNSYRKIKVPEFAPGRSPDYLQRLWDHQMYLTHRRNVREAEPKVDDNPPKLSPHLYVKIGMLEEHQNKMKDIQRQNIQLVRRINLINRTKGKVDCHIGKYPASTSNYGARAARELQIYRENVILLSRLLQKGPVYSYQQMMKDWRRNELLMAHQARYPLQWKVKPTLEEEKRIQRNTIRGSKVVPPRPSVVQARHRCFFDLFIADGPPVGRIVFEIYTDIVPRTALNFLALCKGYGSLRFRGSRLHRIVPGLLCQGGDITHHNGSGGMSIYGEIFPDENFLLRHAGRGVLSMANNGPNTNNSQFNITFRALHTLDCNCVVLGKVVEGIGTLSRLEELGADSGKPYHDIVISNCGLLKRATV